MATSLKAALLHQIQSGCAAPCDTDHASSGNTVKRTCHRLLHCTNRLHSRPSSSCKGTQDRQLPGYGVQARRAGRGGARVQAVAAAEAVSVGVDEQLQQLQKWLADSGVVSNKARFKIEVIDGRVCLVALQNTAPSEEVFSVPDKLWLSVASAKSSPIWSVVEGLELEPWVVVALYLLYERSNPQSGWKAYLDTLPTQPESPLFWSDEELQELEGSQVLSSTLGYKQFAQAKFAELEQDLLSQHRDLFPEADFSEDAFLWAFGTLRAHSHPPFSGEDIALIPLANLVRHRTGASEKEGQPALEKRNVGLFGSQGTAAVFISRQAVSAGQQIVMDYGSDKTVGQLALDYGILEASELGTQRDRFSLTLEIPEGDRFFDDKADIAETNDLAVACQFELKKGEEPSAKLLAFLRLIALSGPDAFLLESIFRATVWEHLLEPLSIDNESAICQSMIDGIRGALQGYPTTTDEDIRLSRQLPTTSSNSTERRKRLAVGVRLSEKRVLVEALDWFEQRFANLDRLEYYQERRLRDLGLMDDQGKQTPWIFNE